MFTEKVKQFLDDTKKAGIEIESGVISTPYGQVIIGEKSSVLTCIVMTLRDLRKNDCLSSDDLKQIIRGTLMSEEEIEEQAKEILEKKKSEKSIEDILKEIEKIINE